MIGAAEDEDDPDTCGPMSLYEEDTQIEDTLADDAMEWTQASQVCTRARARGLWSRLGYRPESD